ncbi:hypothetical protein [Rothia halotolerans]|uniref:hypothetical protein n=1 Tax=Rothia halotolerans TaxID=405770 RepID=UPI00101BDC15|nr:hypothetical protein [Rothia halotolerans]
MSPARGTPGGRLAHAVGSSACFSGIVAALVYSVRGSWVDVAVLLLVGLGQVLAFLAFRTWPARLEASAILLLAGVSSAEQLYDAVPWWDLVVHLLATYALVRIPWNLRLRAGARWAASATLLSYPLSRAPHPPSSPSQAGLERPSRSPAEAPAAPALPTRLRWCLGAGLALAVVWELMEFLGFLLVTPEIHIPPLDTVTDILAGLLGAALCALRTRPA